MGLGAIKSAWQRQTLKYGHEHGDKYSALVFDNRGVGYSDKPVMRYSTSEMALDVIELLDHLGWTKTRQLHIMGVSMGGMIAQEVAYRIPDRICSLSLVSTAARVENTVSFVEHLRTRINMFIPKSLDRSVADAAASMFPDSWLRAKDQTHLPSPDIRGYLPPEKGGSYGEFDTNYERFAAQELNKRLNDEVFNKKGFMMQAVAAGWHYKSPEQLKEIGDKVGRERIQVLHGTEDRMLTIPHGRKLVEWIQPGRSEIIEGSGHVFMLEKPEWYNRVIDELVEKTEKMSKA